MTVSVWLKTYADGGIEIRHTPAGDSTVIRLSAQDTKNLRARLNEIFHEQEPKAEIDAQLQSITKDVEYVLAKCPVPYEGRTPEGIAKLMQVISEIC